MAIHISIACRRSVCGDLPCCPSPGRCHPSLGWAVLRFWAGGRQSAERDTKGLLASCAVPLALTPCITLPLVWSSGRLSYSCYLGHRIRTAEAAATQSKDTQSLLSAASASRQTLRNNSKVTRTSLPGAGSCVFFTPAAEIGLAQARPRPQPWPKVVPIFASSWEHSANSGPSWPDSLVTSRPFRAQYSANTGRMWQGFGWYRRLMCRNHLENAPGCNFRATIGGAPSTCLLESYQQQVVPPRPSPHGSIPPTSDPPLLRGGSGASPEFRPLLVSGLLAFRWSVCSGIFPRSSRPGMWALECDSLIRLLVSYCGPGLGECRLLYLAWADDIGLVAESPAEFDARIDK